MSESLARQNPQSPFRRAPSAFLQNQYGKVGATSTMPVSTDTEELLKIAKDNIRNLKLKGKMVHACAHKNTACKFIVKYPGVVYGYAGQHPERASSPS